MREPKFVSKPGQTDYTHARWAPVINCVVTYRSKILIVKRSKNMRLYPGLWNGIGGFLDDERSLEEKVRDELREELGLRAKDIVSIKLGQIFDADDPKLKRTWVIHPALVKVRTNKIRLDWEAEEYRWVVPEEIENYELVPSFRRVLRNCNLSVP